MTTSDECKDQLARLSWVKGVPAPKDADGKLGVKKLYAGDGEALDVEFIGFNDRWVVKFDRANFFNLNWFHLSKPDSWESLEEDARKAPRDYIEGRGIAAEHGGRVATMTSDIVRRAKALAGVSDRD